MGQHLAIALCIEKGKGKVDIQWSVFIMDG